MEMDFLCCSGIQPWASRGKVCVHWSLPGLRHADPASAPGETAHVPLEERSVYTEGAVCLHWPQSGVCYAPVLRGGDASLHLTAGTGSCKGTPCFLSGGPVSHTGARDALSLGYVGPGAAHFPLRPQRCLPGTPCHLWLLP